MLDLSVIILTKDEVLHIRRCLESVRQYAKRIIVVDSYSTDGTQVIARKLGAEVVEHRWMGNQAAQFNWALDNIPIETEWILRLDADEYLLPELIDELKERLPLVDVHASGVVFKRRHIFLGKWMKRGIYPVKLLRLFRTGHGRYEQRLMDEHVVLSQGEIVEFDNDFCDHNLHNLSWFCKKHIDYAVREAAEMLDLEFNLWDGQKSNDSLSEQASAKRIKKLKYARQPLFWRSFAYFVYRYFLKRGFLQGKEGFLWHFLQGWWYRTLVDAKVYEIKKACGNDPSKIARHLKEQYGIEINT